MELKACICGGEKFEWRSLYGPSSEDYEYYECAKCGTLYPDSETLNTRPIEDALRAQIAALSEAGDAMELLAMGEHSHLPIHRLMEKERDILDAWRKAKEGRDTPPCSGCAALQRQVDDLTEELKQERIASNVLNSHRIEADKENAELTARIATARGASDRLFADGKWGAYDWMDNPCMYEIADELQAALDTEQGEGAEK